MIVALFMQRSIIRTLTREKIALDQSILSQRKDPDQYPEITYLGNKYSEIKLYREWNLGRYTPPRLPQKPDLPGDFLLEDASNLGLVLNDLEHKRRTILLHHLKRFNELISDFSIKIHGGTIQVFIHEEGLAQPIPATRLSDGTLSFLSLLSILCHPTPPPLICIEEPEIGMHPDIIPLIGELLIKASEITQLIVTTHSDILIDYFSETPEAVVVCEKENSSTIMKRLDANTLASWLKKYKLGQLYLKGEIGGTRW
ncbi:MAG: AAA family ATPase [Nitrospinae bacterium]|nr:AAA family ATPase [Nitrospinota bacterium]